jgi:hypothetical protein
MPPKRSTALVKKTPEPDYPWDRQPGESPEAFEAFATYRDLAAFRSIAAVVQKWHKSRSLIARWSAAHHWVQRVDAWDAWNDQEFRKEREQARREMLQDQLELGKKMIKMADEMVVGGALAGTPLSLKDVPAFAKTGQALAADALGLDGSGGDLEQETQNRMFREAVLRGIDEADRETGARIRQHLYKLERARVANGG